MFFQFLSIIYSLVIFCLVRGNPFTSFQVYFHFNSLCDMLTNHAIVHNYLYVVAEELLFRLPLLYSLDYFWYLLITFSFIHCQLSASLQRNLGIMVHTFVCGYLFSLIGFPYSIPFHIFNNALYDFHDITISFRKKNSRMILDHLRTFK
jgi:hypothetical protein